MLLVNFRLPFPLAIKLRFPVRLGSRLHEADTKSHPSKGVCIY